jgi:hypothetical protein
MTSKKVTSSPKIGVRAVRYSINYGFCISNISGFSDISPRVNSPSYSVVTYSFKSIGSPSISVTSKFYI